jgi:very-short-patch-repair endonuclease
MAKILEEKFLTLWEEFFPDISLEREMKLIEKRRFRVDFLEPKSKVCIEINGGNWVGGRHSRPAGLENEYEKNLLLATLGYQVICLSGKQITEDNLYKIEYIISARKRLFEENKCKEMRMNKKT